MRAAWIAVLLVIPAVLDAAPPERPTPAPRNPGPPEPEQRPPEQQEADRHFKRGVALFKEAKYAEALAEFERAYQIAPHPLVLYNIAGCHRELSHYADAVTYYGRLLADGSGKVPAARLADARAELDAILALIARVTVVITPAEGATLIVDGAPLDRPAMPLVLVAGEHRLVARAPGRRDAERSVRAVPGDVLTVELALGEPVAPATIAPAIVEPIEPIGIAPAAASRRFALGAGFGNNLLLARDTGAPSLGFAAAIGTRLELGVDVLLVAYAVVPAVRVRLAGDALALHAVGTVPISRGKARDDPMTVEWFVAGALGLGLRYRPTSRLAVRLESCASFASKAHGTSIPTFLAGELWF
jgi:hypothetical protein